MSVDPLTVSNLACWMHAGAEVYIDDGVTAATDGDTVRRNDDVSPAGLIRSNATAGQRPILRAASLAVPALEYNKDNNCALLFPVNDLDLRTNDATIFWVVQQPLPNVANNVRAAGSWAIGDKGVCLGVKYGAMQQTFITDNTNYAGLNLADIDAVRGDVVIVAVRWDNSLGKIEIHVQRSDHSVLQLDVTDTVAALANVDIDSASQLAMGRCADQTTLDWSGREYHFLHYSRWLDDSELQGIADYLREHTDLVSQLWTASRDAGNPINSIPAGESSEQYVPAPVLVATDDRWFYCKGSLEIYAWKSPDFSSGFTIQNSGNPVITRTLAGTDGANSILEASAVYDSANNTIHVYARGMNASNVPSVIHFTAADSDPTSFTKQSTVMTTSAFSPDSVGDFHLSSTIKIGSTWHHYGGRQISGGKWQLWHGTSTGWDGAITLDQVYNWPGIPGAESGDTMVQWPSVFKNQAGAGYYMIYTAGLEGSGAGERNLYLAFSEDGINDWQHVGTVLIHLPNGTPGWERSRVYCAHLLMGTTGSFDAPAAVNGQWQLFYSGSDRVVANDDLVGILNLDIDASSASSSQSGSASTSGSSSQSTSASMSASTSESSSESSSESNEATTATMNLTVTMTRQDILETTGRVDQLTVGPGRQAQTLTLGTSEVTIALETSIVDAGLMYVKHHGTIGYVDIGYSTGVYPNRVYAGEPGLIPLAIGTSTLYVAASGPNTKFEYEITERSLT